MIAPINCVIIQNIQSIQTWSVLRLLKSVSSVDTIWSEKVPMNDLSRTFDEVVSIIETARSNAFRKVNEELKTEIFPLLT